MVSQVAKGKWFWLPWFPFIRNQAKILPLLWVCIASYAPGDIWQVIIWAVMERFLFWGVAESNPNWCGWIIPYIYFFLHSIYLFLFTGSAFLSAIFLALATYQSLYPLTLFVPGLLYLLQVSTCWSEANTQVTFNTWPVPCLGERRARHNKGNRTGSPIHISLLLLDNAKKLD